MRIGLLSALFLFSFLGVAARLVQLQAFPNTKFNPDSRGHVGEIEIPLPRGEICDRNGGLMATDRQAASLWADPREVLDPYTTALQLSAWLGVDEDRLLERLTRRDENGERMKFVWVKRWLSNREQDRFQALPEAVRQGLGLRSEPVRFYPEGELAAHVMGFANREGDGGAGIELAFDKYLRSEPGRQRSRVDRNRILLASLTLEYIEPEGGNTVYLTLDKVIQNALERALDDALVRTEAPRGMGLVMDPRTGAVLALACRPAFDPNRYTEYPASLYKNRALTDVFEPGSAFKIVTASAALEHGLITPDTVIDCENGHFNPYGHRIHDFHKLGEEPFRACFKESSNIAMVKVAAMLGEERLEQWIRRFGFGQRTSPDFQGESRGIFRPVRAWSGLSMGALPIGQEVAVTMPQLARAFSVIANGGFLVTPYFVDRVENREGEVVYRHPGEAPERILSAETATVMRELCHLVVMEGTGQRASIPEYRVGGKTGTAQVARAEGGGYHPDKYTAVFAGFAPVADPWVCAVIVIQEPGIRERWGGYCCGPVFQEVVREALIRLNCPEDPVAVTEKHPPAHLAEAPTEMEREEAPRPRYDPGPTDELALLLPLPELVPQGPLLPDFAGLTMAEAVDELNELGLPWDFQGAGRVASQDPPALTPLGQVQLCRLRFSPVPNKENDETLGNRPPAEH